MKKNSKIKQDTKQGYKSGYFPSIWLDDDWRGPITPFFGRNV